MIGVSHLIVGAHDRLASAKKEMTNERMNTLYDAGIRVQLSFEHAPKFRCSSQSTCSMEIVQPLIIAEGS